MNKNPRNYFPSIDILRGFAAISVVVYHVIEHYNWTSFPQEGWLVWFRIGWMGVDLFFVISGFVIGLSAFTEIDRHGVMLFRTPFMRRRIVRIVPLYLLTGLIFTVFITPELLFENFWPNVITHLLFIHNWFLNFQGSINGVNWSLGTEMQFYILMLIVAPWIKVARVWKVVISFIGIAWLWRWGSVSLVALDGPQGAFPLFVASTQLLGMLDEFIMGLLFAKLLVGGYFSALLTNRAWLWSIPLAASGLTITLVLFWRYASFWDIPLMVIFFRTLLSLAFVLVLFAACTLNSSKWLAVSSPFRYLGTISYGIYLWHLPVLLSLKRITWLPPEKALPIILVLTMLFASISWHFFEKPITERFGRKIKHEGVS